MKSSPRLATPALLSIGAFALSAGPLSLLASESEAEPGSAAATLADPVRMTDLAIEDLEGPDFADVDGDGLRDLLSGNYDGQLLFRKNSGSATAPDLASAAVPLQSGGGDITLKHW